MSCERPESVVQPTNWYSALPRPEYLQWPKVETGDEWFEVYELPHQVYALYEPGHFQEVISFLILGAKKAILLDTGMGIGNIKKVVEKLTDFEITVVNSHFHFDHIGNNYRFPKVAIFDEEFAVNRLRKGYSREELREHLTGDAFWKKPPRDFDPLKYQIPGVTPLLLHDGDLLDLGGRELQVLSTPGHTKDSIMLWDKDNRLLFTGDTFYPAALYAHFGNDFYGYSDLYTYSRTMEKLAKLVPSLDYLYCSHNVPVEKPVRLADTAAAFCSIIQGLSTYQIDEQGLRRYDFQGFSVITNENF